MIRPRQGEPSIARSIPPVIAYPDRACKGADLKIFYPPVGGSQQKTKDICDACNYETECLSWALETRQGFGVWGGKSADERANMIRRDR